MPAGGHRIYSHLIPVMIFAAAIGVVVYQLRRRELLRRIKDEEARRHIQTRSSDEAQKVVIGTITEGGHQDCDEQDGDYTDVEDDDEEADYNKSKGISSKSKSTRCISDNSHSEPEIFSHPSEMPPKYYWNHRYSRP